MQEASFCCDSGFNKQLSALKLAFLGDAVFELYVRRFLVYKYREKLGKLNERKSKFSCCRGQSFILKKISKFLTEEEIRICKSGQSAHINNFSKKAIFSEYRKATGFECLLGYLYINNKMERIEQIFSKAMAVCEEVY